MVSKHRTNPNYKALYNTGKQSINRFAWAKNSTGTFTGMIYDNSEMQNEDAEELGPDIVLYLPQPNSRAVSYNLSAMTLEELQATRQLLNLLLDLAEPVCKERDRIANEAFNRGDDSFARSYRSAPQYVVREGSLRENYKGVHNGFEDILARSRTAGGSKRSVRGDGDAVANSESEDSSGQDDWAPFD